MPPARKRPNVRAEPPAEPPAEPVAAPSPARKRTGREKSTSDAEKGAQAARARAGKAKAHAELLAEHERKLAEDEEYATVNTREEALRNAPTFVHLTLTGKMAQLYLGLRSVKDMDDEELARMQFRDKNGRFTGSPPRCLPGELISMIRTEMLDRAAVLFNGSLLASVETLRDIATSSDVDPAVRIRASGMLIERVLGKTPDKVEFSTGAKPFEVVFSDLSRNMGALDEDEEGDGV